MLHQPFFIPAVLFLFLAIPLIFELIPQNPFYGVRTVKTLADKDLWYRANKYIGWALIFSSIFYLVIAAMIPSSATGTTDFGRWILHLGAFLLPLILSLLFVGSYLKRS
jgi:uncharacterized membrane protein YhdT